MWLPEGYSWCSIDRQVAVNYLTRHAAIKCRLAHPSPYVKKYRLVFRPDDVDSCESCMALNGKEFDGKSFPELPCENCTSETGCMCDIVPVWESVDTDEDTVASDEGADDDDEALDTLRQLKEMLDDGLITQAEYDAKKKEVLSRM